MKHNIPLQTIRHQSDYLVHLEEGQFLEWHREDHVRLLLWSSNISLLDFLDKANELFGSEQDDSTPRGGIVYDGLPICTDAPYEEVRTSGEIPIIKNTHTHMDFGPERTVTWSSHPSDGDLARGSEFAEVSLRFTTRDRDRAQMEALISETATAGIARYASSILAAAQK